MLCRSGVLVLGTGESLYADGAFLNDIAEGAKVQRLVPPQRNGPSYPNGLVEQVDSDSDESTASSHRSRHTRNHSHSNLHSIFAGTADNITLGPSLMRAHAYMNYDGGWAHAERGVSRAIDLVLHLGGKVIGGKEVVELLKDGEPDGRKNSFKPKTCGVRCADGSEFLADIVIIATGAWTASAFPDLPSADKCLATGYVLFFVHLYQAPMGVSLGPVKVYAQFSCRKKRPTSIAPLPSYWILVHQGFIYSPCDLTFVVCANKCLTCELAQRGQHREDCEAYGWIYKRPSNKK